MARLDDQMQEIEDLLTALRDRLPAMFDDGRLAVDLPAGSGGLTDSELRATPVAVSMSGTMTVAEPVTVDGAVMVSNFPATQPVSGSVTVSDGSGSLTVDGTVSVGNFPSVQPVSDNGGSLTVDGAVSVSNFPATQPVSGPLTDTQLRASAVPVKEFPAAMTWVSLKSAAPAANAVQADTGALAAGDYDFDVSLGSSDTVAVGKGLLIEHRNAANSATLQTLGGIGAGDSMQFQFRRVTVAANERIRVIAGTAAGAASSMYVSAIGRRVS